MQANLISFNIYTVKASMQSFEIEGSFYAFQNIENQLKKRLDGNNVEVENQILVLIFFTYYPAFI